jgi:putative colanic acid biosynthesis acetyltransferase WcaF
MRLKDYDNSDFDRGAPLWKEALWMLVKSIFFLNHIPWPSGLRNELLRLFGARVGQGVVIRSHVNITFPWRLSVGDDVWIGEETLILSLAQVTIESDVCISRRAFLCTGSHDFRAPKFDLITKPITVRRGSWVAAQAFVAPGVEVGSGSLISAGSVLLENAPPKSLVRGNPAVVVKKFEETSEPAP